MTPHRPAPSPSTRPVRVPGWATHGTRPGTGPGWGTRATRPGTGPGWAPTSRRLAWAAALLAAAGVAACDSPVDATPDALEIRYEGRAERGLSLVLQARDPAGEPLAPGTVAWRVDPADAGTWRGDTLRLARAGTIEVVAEHAGRTGARSIDVAVPPTILFDMTVDGNTDLYRAALDGGELERLTTHAAADADPTVAGDVVVFVSERDGNDEAYALPLAGGAATRLTATAAAERHPALSPDGGRLAFVRGWGLTRVYVAAPDASGAVRPDPAHGHDGTLEVAPAWSPDGRTLAFVSTAAGGPDLYAWSGGTATLLEAGAAGDFEPAWSPDGRHVAFASNRTGDVELYLLDPGAGTVRRLTEREGSDGHPAWLPDGRIVYVAYSGSTPELRWLDPADPAATHRVPLPGPAANPIALPAAESGRAAANPTAPPDA
ncbi:MAG TPA: hypothetical protein VF212_17100 [Longimicrobiales bacterium]